MLPGVLGQPMLGGVDKGASGALIQADALAALKAAVQHTYPLIHPQYAGPLSRNFSAFFDLAVRYCSQRFLHNMRLRLRAGGCGS